jgi:hypothetical protein
VRAAPKFPLVLTVRRALTVAVGCAGLIWGVLTLPRSDASDEFRDTEGRLLHFETFSRPGLARALADQSSQDLSACDTHAQRAMLLMEMPLADAALRSGAADEFDQHVRSLEDRSRRILACTPRESFVWLVMFDLEVLHGQLNERSFELLAMSYETSPNEAWIAIRRIVVAMPLVLNAPEPLRRRILFEFQQLIRNGFVDDAARTYSAASGSIRPLLQTQIEQLDPEQRKRFSEALQRRSS